MHVVLHAASFSSGGHPNKMKFEGVLVRLDEPSDKPPGGAEGHRIMLPSTVAKKRIGTLIGMGLNYSPSLDGHAQRRKVGVIEDAGIDGKKLWVKGYVWKHDFPEAEDDLKQSGLGMSMELGDVKVKNPKADVWELEDCCFLGGTILWKGKAAYHNTRAIAAAKQGGGKMAKTATAKKPVKKVPGALDEAGIAKIAASAAASAVGSLMAGQIKRQTDLMEAMATKIDSLSAEEDDEDEDVDTTTVDASTDDEDVEAAGKKKGEEDDGEDGEDDGEDGEEDDDEDDVDATSSENKPGEENSDAKNHGDDTTEDDDVGTKVNEPVTGAASVKKLRRALKAERQKSAGLQAQIDTLSKQMKKLNKQVTASAERITRRTLDPATVGLLAKSNINAAALVESGQKLSVTDVDAVIAAGESASGVRYTTEQKISLKNKLFNDGIMDEGRVDRGYAFQ